jgi:hypothetical protein
MGLSNQPGRFKSGGRQSEPGSCTFRTETFTVKPMDGGNGLDLMDTKNMLEVISRPAESSAHGCADCDQHDLYVALQKIIDEHTPEQLRAMIDARESAASAKIPTEPVGAPQISLRDWLAGMALIGLCVNGEPEDVKHNAIVAYRNADAMLEQRDDQMVTT